MNNFQRKNISTIQIAGDCWCHINTDKLLWKAKKHGKGVELYLLEAMKKAYPVRKFLIDGYPHAVDRTNSWEKLIGEKWYVCGVVFLDCTKERMQQRLIYKWKQAGKFDNNTTEAEVKQRIED